MTARGFESLIEKVDAAKKGSALRRAQGEAQAKTAKSASERAAAQAQIQQANSALRVLSQTEQYLAGEPVPPESLKQVTEVVRWIKRNVWVNCQGLPWMNDKSAALYGPILEPHTSQLRASTRAVGRISAYDLDANGKVVRTRGTIGTAIAIGRRQIVTNKHVIVDGQVGYINVLDASKMTLWSNVSGKIVFPVEYERCKPAPEASAPQVTIVAIDYVDPNLDFVVARVDADLQHFVTFPANRDMVSGDRIAVIGYPTRPGDNETFLSPVQIDQVFITPDGRTPFGIQRFAEGYTLPTEADLQAGYFRYDATTWGGNSGSLVINLATGAIIGLHARGLQASNQGAGYNEAVGAEGISGAIQASSLLIAAARMSR